MKHYLLDTSALLTLHNDEPGSDRLVELFALAANGQAQISACFMTQYEIFYRVWKNQGEQSARMAYASVQALPIKWINQSTELLELAAAIKAQNKLSAMDAWIAASAMLTNATLVHKDPEFESLRQPQELLPLKA